MPTTRTRTKAVKTKQQQYRFTDEEEEDDSEENNESPAAGNKVATTKNNKSKTIPKKNEYGGILAVLDDNQKKGNITADTKRPTKASKNVKATTTTNNNNKTEEEELLPVPPPTKTKASKPPSKTTARTRAKTTRVSSPPTDSNNISNTGTVTPQRKSKDHTIKSNQPLPVAGATPPPPTSILIANHNHTNNNHHHQFHSMSPPTPGFGLSTPARRPRRAGGRGGRRGGATSTTTTTTPIPGTVDDDVISAMSCSVASVLSPPPPRPATSTTTTMKFYEKRLCPSTGEQSPAWEYRAGDQEAPDEKEEENDDATTVEGSHQRSYIGEAEEEDESYIVEKKKKNKSTTQNDVDETTIGEGGGSDSEQEDDDDEGTEDASDEVDLDDEEDLVSEPESEDDEESAMESSSAEEEDDDESEEYIPDDDEDSMSEEEDDFEFDEIEKPEPVKTRRGGRAKNNKKESTPEKETIADSPGRDASPDEPQDNDMYMDEDDNVETPPSNENDSVVSNANNPNPATVPQKVSAQPQPKVPRSRTTKNKAQTHKEHHSPIVLRRLGTSPHDEDTDVEASPMIVAKNSKQFRQALGSPEPVVAVILDDDDEGVDEDDDVVAKVLDVSAYVVEDDKEEEETCEVVDDLFADHLTPSKSFDGNVPETCTPMEGVDSDGENEYVGANESFMTADEADNASVLCEVEEDGLGMTLKQSEKESRNVTTHRERDPQARSIHCQAEGNTKDIDEIGTEMKQSVKDQRSEDEAIKSIANKEEPQISTSLELLCTPTKISTKAFKKHHRHEGIVKRGKWNLGAKIGVGSFGVVHVGMNTETGTLMAVKTFKMEGAVMKDIRREIELMRSLHHVNIVRYYGAQADKSHLHIFQEWVPAGSVATLLSKFGPFAMTVTRRYLSQILSGLAYLHENNIMHRDIKGSNILVSDEGIVKLADFGASKKLANLQEDLLMSLTVRGTPYFMAPEVFEEKYSAKADVWGAGCVAVQMATGSPPWKEMGFTNPISLFNYIKRHEGPPVLDIPGNDENMSDGDKRALHLFEKLLKKCFQKDPSMRPSARILLDDSFFLEVHNGSDDDQTPCRGFFSPGSETSASFWSNEAGPSSIATPSPHRLSRSKSVVQWKATFLSPPLPKRNPDRNNSPSPLRPSPARHRRYSPVTPTPVVDTSEWPKWALDRRKSLLEKENATLHQPSTRPAERLSDLMGSLAISEDSDIASVHHGRNNPFRSSNTNHNQSVEVSHLEGLNHLNDGSSSSSYFLEHCNSKYEL
jgi:serine/threonine protein kinase